ncbi:DUF4062 domain-containing protein [Nannocystis punicea]|uniref:DUF4062 domain-containing protein n=1 Tax=Nannocystis punicea TaxID=2995304 RepID=A0ABY7H515_9BACT|nr:DUF4062 domain-containing protein [Nannocystis poenicansa]WAS94202.1 DUF4062 domain-containing protein [Nannocystis poenicansa]
MDKRYQIFVSSTYTDLKDERAKVIQTLMEMDCIPAGMELFPAADEEQWQFIKKVIDDCDYYLLIIGGRYGSTTPEGISYTEKEYDYAVDKGLKVIALIHGDPDSLPLSKSETVPAQAEKLAAFRAKVKTGRLVRFWQDTTELPGLVALSLSKTIKTYPAIGWVRANTVANVDLLTDNNLLRKKIAGLEAQLHKLQEEHRPAVDDLAGLDEHFTVRGNTTHFNSSDKWHWEGTISWREAFGLLAPHLLQRKADDDVRHIWEEAVARALEKKGRFPRVEDQTFQTFKVQMLAQKLISVESRPTTTGALALFWFLTEKGKAFMLDIRTIKKMPPVEQS